MDFDSPDVAKEFPGLYAAGNKKTSDSDEEKGTRLDILGKKKESKKDKGYKVFEGESSDDDLEDARSPGKSKKKSFKFPGKDRKEKSKGKDKEKKEEKEKVSKKSFKKEVRDVKVEVKDSDKAKKKKEINIIKIKHKKKKGVRQEVKEEKPIFGIPLHVAVERNKSHDGIELPVIVRECIDYIEEHGLACEGIYRISGLKSKVRQLKDLYNRGEKVYMYEHEPHVVASLLKQFLRDLPEPILTSDLAPKFEEAAALKNNSVKVEALKKLLSELPTCNRLLVSWVIIHMLHVVSMEKRNKMNLQNVYIVLSPTIQTSHNILHAFFAFNDVLFSGIEIKKYTPPINLDSSRLSLELPDSPSAIAEELSKQEGILNILHAELNTGLRDRQKEERLWEIQRVVTQLKRKLRFLRQVQETACPPLSCELQTEKDSLCLSTSHTTSNQAASVELPKIASEVTIKSTEEQPLQEISNVSSSTLKESTICVTENNINEASSPSIPVTPEMNIPSSVENKLHSPPDCEDVSKCIEKENDSSVINSLPDTVETSSNEPQFSNSEKKELLDSNSIYSNQTANDEEDLESLILTERMLRIKSDELILIGEELRKKIYSEKMDMSRLESEILEYQNFYKFKKYSFDSVENSSLDSDESSSSGDAEEDLPEILKDLMIDNKEMKEKNVEVLRKIQHERELILNAKVQMKLLMQGRMFNTNAQEEHLI